jgi:hypothetical protein
LDVRRQQGLADANASIVNITKSLTSAESLVSLRRGFLTHTRLAIRSLLYDMIADGCAMTVSLPPSCHLRRLDTRPNHAFVEVRTSASHVHSSSKTPSKAPRLFQAMIGLFSCSCGCKCKTSLTVVRPTSTPKSSTRITRGLGK